MGSDASKARGWRYDERMERLARLRDKRPGEYEKLSPSFKMSLGYYEADKQLAKAAGIDTSGGGGEE